MTAGLRWIWPFVIVLAISGGQVLFKLSANLLRQNGGQLSLRFVAVVLVSLALYGAATIGWIWILQSFALSRVYPVMALSFVLVPLAGWYVFGERLSLGYGLGTALLLAGLLVIFRSQAQG